jgi:hypothetical protein
MSDGCDRQANLTAADQDHGLGLKSGLIEAGGLPSYTQLLRVGLGKDGEAI